MISSEHLTAIRSKLPSDCNYFIAGGSLLPGYYSDIDIYFYTEHDYLMARSALGPEQYSTENADTYSISYDDGSLWSSNSIQVQLVHRSFGTPYDILSDFDLNKSRQALLLDGTLYQHPTFHSDLYFDIDNFRANTIARLQKYMYNKDQQLDIPKFQSNVAQLLSRPLDTSYGHYYLLDEHLECTTVVILRKAISNCLFFFSLIHPIVESLDPDTRLAIYQTLISRYTDMVPTESMSNEFNLFTYLNNELDSQYNTQSHRILFPSVQDAYPEYLI